MRKGILALFLTLSHVIGTAQNCNTTVNLSEDLTLCEPNNSVPIVGIITGNIETFRWSPATLLSDSNTLNTTANISETTTFRLDAFSISEVDLITNGDFSQGNTGFFTDYQLKTGGGNLNEGFYAVARSPRDVHGGFARYGDHTGNNGNMLVVNAFRDAEKVWCQNITVIPGNAYLFSAWVASAVSENPAELQFSINDQLLGENFKASSRTGTWEQFTAFWEAESLNTAQICIQNVNNNSAGNDFTLDDIEFRELCRNTDSVRIEVLDLVADFDLPTTFCQNEDPIVLDDFLTNTTTPNGTWTIDGIPSATLDPANLASGSHLVSYFLDQSGCTASSNLSFEIIPIPNAGTPVQDTFNFCADLDTTLFLENFVTNAEPGGLWTLEQSPLPVSPSFVLDGGAIGLTSPPIGSYAIRYTIDGSSDCPASTTDLTILVEPLPPAMAGEDQMLFCPEDQLVLGDQSTTEDPILVYTWTNEQNQAISNSPTATVNEVGSYILNTLNSVTGCTNQDTAIVTSSNSFTEIEASVEVIGSGCEANQPVSISVTNIKGGEPPYAFGLDGGPLQENATFENVSEGVHIVLIQDSNGCEATLSANVDAASALNVQIISSSNLVINPGDSLTINLFIDVPLNTIDSIVWEPSIPNCNGCQNPTIRPIKTTEYQVQVFDLNGCTSAASILVEVNESGIAYLPNVFSPNGDGNNDVFFVNSGALVAQVKEFNIFDRWGNLVFSQENTPPNNPDFGWNGAFNNELVDAGVYLYFAELELQDGSIKVESGSLTLLR